MEITAERLLPLPCLSPDEASNLCKMFTSEFQSVEEKSFLSTRSGAFFRYICGPHLTGE